MTTTIDLRPASVSVYVLEGEPSPLRLPITVNGAAVDVAVDYPDLVTRLKVGDAEPVEIAVSVEDTNVVVATIPALEAGVKVWWELRDAAADSTWVRATIRVEKDQVPQ